MINNRTLIQTATQSGETSEPQEMPSPVIWAHFPFLGCQSEAFVTGADGQRQLKMAEFHSLSPLGGALSLVVNSAPSLATKGGSRSLTYSGLSIVETSNREPPST